MRPGEWGKLLRSRPKTGDGGQVFWVDMEIIFSGRLPSFNPGFSLPTRISGQEQSDLSAGSEGAWFSILILLLPYTWFKGSLNYGKLTND